MPHRHLPEVCFRICLCVMLTFAFAQVFDSGREHQLDTVQLVYLAGTRIIVNGYNIGFRILAAQLFDNALTYHMVWQTAKRLGTYDIWHAGMDQLQHLAGQKPAFTGLVTAADDRLCIFCQLIDPCGWLKTIAASASLATLR